MKSTKDFRSKQQPFDSEDLMKKTAKLEPLKKSGKERHTLYSRLPDEQDEDQELFLLRKKESILDYYDDQEDQDEEDDPDQEEDQDEELYDEDQDEDPEE